HDRDELGSEAAAGILHREVLLVMAHHRDEDLFGKLQKLWIEAAGNRGWVLGEVDECFQQGGVGLDPNTSHALTNPGAALFGGEDDIVIAKALFVIGGGDGNLAGAEAAMTGGQGAGAHAGEFEGNDVVAKEGDNPADRANKAGSTLPGPIHGFREID